MVMAEHLSASTAARAAVRLNAARASSDQFGFAGVADQKGVPPWIAHLLLKDRLSTVLVATCAYVMRRFGSLFLELNSVSKHSRRNLRQPVALLFSIPVFKFYYLLFQITYAIGQFRLRCLGRHCAGLGGHDLSRQFNGLLPHKLGIADTQHRLCQIRADLQRAEEA